MSGRKIFVAVTLLLVSTAMVVGTWLAADDMRAKPLVAAVTRSGETLRLENTGPYAWQDVRVTVNGRYVGTLAAPVESGAGFTLALRDLRTAAGEPMPASERAIELALVVTRRPRFPKVNRERTASGTFFLD